MDFLDAFAQAMILVTGLVSIILIAKKSKWGWIAGLAAQPFWYYTSYVNGQWGVFLNSVMYTFAWAFGAYAWFKEDEKAGGAKGTKGKGKPGAKGKKRGK